MEKGRTKWSAPYFVKQSGKLIQTPQLSDGVIVPENFAACTGRGWGVADVVRVRG
jgi:hypothetical protein